MPKQRHVPIHRQLALRETGNASRRGAQANQARQLYRSLVPNLSAQVDVPLDIHIARFSPCGCYLVCFGSAPQELIVYRCKGSRPADVQSSSGSSSKDPSGGAIAPSAFPQADPGHIDAPTIANTDASPTAPFHHAQPDPTGSQSGTAATFSSFFQLLHRTSVSARASPIHVLQGPSAVTSTAAAGHGPSSTPGAAAPGASTSPAAADPAAPAAAAGGEAGASGTAQTGPLALNKDFALFPLWGEGEYPLVLLASQTPAVPEGRQQSPQQQQGPAAAAAATTPAAMTVVPYVEQTMLHLLRLDTGEVLDTVTFKHDFIHLAGQAGVNLHADLLAVLLLRSQQIHLLQVVRHAVLVPVVTLGAHCSPDDALALRLADDAEAKWRAEKARVLQEQQLQAQSMQAAKLRAQQHAQRQDAVQQWEQGQQLWGQVGEGVLSPGQTQCLPASPACQSPLVAAPKPGRRGLGLWRGLWGLGGRHRAGCGPQPPLPPPQLAVADEPQAAGLQECLCASDSPSSQDSRGGSPPADCKAGGGEAGAWHACHRAEGRGTLRARVDGACVPRACGGDRAAANVCGVQQLAGRKRPSGSTDLELWERAPSLRRSLNGGGRLSLHTTCPAAAVAATRQLPSLSAPQLHLELPPELLGTQAQASLQANLLYPSRSHASLRSHPSTSACPLSPLPSEPLTSAPAPPAPHTFSQPLTHPAMAIVEGIERTSSGGQSRASSLGDSTLLSAFGSDQGRASSVFGDRGAAGLDGRASHSRQAAAAVRLTPRRGSEFGAAPGNSVHEDGQSVFAQPQQAAPSSVPEHAPAEQLPEHLGGDPQRYLQERALLWNRTALQEMDHFSMDMEEDGQQPQPEEQHHMHPNLQQQQQRRQRQQYSLEYGDGMQQHQRASLTSNMQHLSLQGRLSQEAANTVQGSVNAPGQLPPGVAARPTRHSRTPSLQGAPDSSPSPSPAPFAHAMDNLSLRSPSPLGQQQQGEGEGGGETSGGYLAGSSNLVTGLKQRILSHLFLCAMQRGREGSAASRRQRKQQQQLELHKFYRSFEEIKALVIWRAQLLDRDLLLLDLGSQGSPETAGADGGAAGGSLSVMGPQQSQYIALYDWRCCRVRAFCRATSDAALALLYQHADVLGADVGGALWGRFSAQGAHVEAVRRLVASALAPPGSCSSGGGSSGGSSRPGRNAGQSSGGSGPGPGRSSMDGAAAAGNCMRPMVDRQAVVRRVLGGLLPGGAQLLSPSPLLDRRLFVCDNKVLMPAIPRARACSDAHLQFHHTAAHSHPSEPAFRLDLGPCETFNPSGRLHKRALLFLVHPYMPLVLTVTSSVGPAGPQATVTVHFRE